MRRLRFIGVSVAVAAAAILQASAAPPGGVAPVGAKARLDRRGVSFSGNTGIMLPCPTNIGIVVTVRAIVPAGFNPANTPRSVFYKAPSPNESQADADTNYGTLVPGIFRNEPNPYHMDLRSVPLMPTPSGKLPYAEIRIMLLDTADYSGFYNLENINGVGFGGNDNTLQMCGAQFDGSTNPVPPYPVVFFFVPVNPPTATPAATGTFNFGLFPKAAPDTPIFIDPKVINNG